MVCFIDESGDRGTASGSSRFLILAALVLKDKKVSAKILRSMRSVLKARHIKVKEFHAYHADCPTKIRILKRIGCLGNQVTIYTVVFDKKLFLFKKVKPQRIYGLCLQKLVNSLEKSLQEALVDANEPRKVFKKIVSEYLGNLTISINSTSSHNEAGVQLADFVSWAIYIKYEKNDDTYFKLINKQIKKEILLKIENPLL